MALLVSSSEAPPPHLPSPGIRNLSLYQLLTVRLLRVPLASTTALLALRVDERKRILKRTHKLAGLCLRR